ncbi:MAG: hypothetical protein FWE99_02665 [Bacteroidales bacterium]|nr:hypothetical protein [Bacteroidales bacterium]
MLFSSIPGHTLLKERLIDMANVGRVGHALLFWGEEGVGGLPLALALAQQMACKTKEQGLACGACPTCNKMQKLLHPDLHFAVPVNRVKPSDPHPITDLYMKQWKEALLANPYMLEYQWYEALGIDKKSGNISVHEAESILKKISFKPFSGDCTFMLIWLPERMNVQAANTLLKALEEPPAGTHFFLVSEHPEQLLPTIRSRCQNVRINPMSIEDLAAALTADLLILPQDAELLARISAGSYGKALYATGQSDRQEEANAFAYRLFDGALSKDLRALIQWAEEAAGFGRELQKQTVLHLLALLREIYMEHLKAHRLVYVPEAESLVLKAWAAGFPSSFFPLAAAALNDSLSDIERNLQNKMIFYSLALHFFFAS